MTATLSHAGPSRALSSLGTDGERHAKESASESNVAQLMTGSFVTQSDKVDEPAWCEPESNPAWTERAELVAIAIDRHAPVRADGVIALLREALGASELDTVNALAAAERQRKLTFVDGFWVRVTDAPTVGMSPKSLGIHAVRPVDHEGHRA
jgi:hypothetical protein